MFGTYSFKGGIFVSGKKPTAGCAIEPFTPPSRLIIPLSQHIGFPANVLVKRGDPVKIGSLLGESGGVLSSPVHSSVSGTVLSVAPFAHPRGKRVLAVEIENDGKDDRADFKPLDRPWRDVAPGELVQAVAAAGVVGMGGESQPAHLKLFMPVDREIDFCIVNGAESEPLVSGDHRLLVERTEAVLTGALILKKIVGAKKVCIGIERNKPDAIAAVAKAIQQEPFNQIGLVKLATKYPQGAERLMVKTIARREIPEGGRAIDAGCTVHNVATAFAVWDAIINGTPSYQRTVTVAGSAVKTPKNFLVRIGTPVNALLDACGIDWDSTVKVLCGGPMLGLAQADPEVPVVKATSSVIALTTLTPAVQANDCIRCGRCTRVCPMRLVPAAINQYCSRERYVDAVAWGVLDCIVCGSCAYVCPSKINLVHHFKLARYHVQSQKAATGELQEF